MDTNIIKDNPIYTNSNVIRSIEQYDQLIISSKNSHNLTALGLCHGHKHKKQC